jgi:PAS domain S-box-containing protein
MSLSIIKELINNAGLLLSITLIYDLLVLKKEPVKTLRFRITAGVFLGLTGIVLMILALDLLPGIVLDNRAILLGIAGFFFGIVPTVIAMTITVVFRIFLGGTGILVGIAVIVSSGVIGLLWKKITGLTIEKTRFKDFYLFGLVLHANMILRMFINPAGTPTSILVQTGVLAILVFPAATTAVGWILQQRLASWKAMDNLEKSERKFREYINNAPYGVFVMDMKGIVKDVNETASRFSGYSREDLIGNNFQLFIDKNDYKRGFDVFSSLLSNGSINVDFPVDYKNGYKGIINFTISKIGHDTFLGFANDITEQRKALERERKSEELYRTIVETSQEGILVLDNSFRVSVVNRKTAELLGYSGIEEMTGIKGRALIFEEDIDTFERGHYTHPKIAVGVHELRMKRKDGTLLWVLISSSPLKDERGEFTGSFAMFSDIDSRKRMEEELNLSNRRLKLAIEKANLLAMEARSANQVKGRFLAQMSHEIRTPLNGVIGMIALLMRTHLNEEQKEYAEAIEYSGKSLLSLINDILDFSKIEAGKVMIERVCFDLHSLLAEIHRSYVLKAREKAITFLYDIDEALPQTLYGDPGRIRQIYANLLDNAVKYTEKGNITATVQVIDNQEAYLTVLFRVTDTGLGIAPDKQEMLFSPFTQLRAASTQPVTGTGLGLSIVKELVTLMKGEIGYDSEENRGSSFWFSLPLDKNLSSETPLPVSTETKEIRSFGTGDAPVKILVAEDNFVNQLMMKRIIEKMHMEVVVANNGYAVLDELETNHYDLVLMDCQMPEMDGWEATRIIRSGQRKGIDGKVPIIAMTAYAMSGDKERCFEAGMDDYLSKPVDYAVLLAKLSKWIIPSSSSHRDD